MFLAYLTVLQHYILLAVESVLLAKPVPDIYHKVYVGVVFVLPVVYWSQTPRGRNCQVGPVKQQMSALASPHILCCSGSGRLPRGAGSQCLADLPSFNILLWLIWSEVVLHRWDHDTLWDKQFVTQPFSLLRQLRAECQAGLVSPDITSVSVSQAVVHAAGREPALQPCLVVWYLFAGWSARRTSSQSYHISPDIPTWSHVDLTAYCALIGLWPINLSFKRISTFYCISSISPLPQHPSAVFVRALSLAYIWRDQETS